ncbi:MAG: hypothetical protein WCA77_05120, partial [Thermoplasmata archaeon]
IHFFDVTSLNCLRTLPSLRRWKDVYAADGFTLIGVHAPEFAFAREPALVASSLKRLGIDWPVVSDPDFTLARRFSSRFWPSTFLVDARGNLRFYHVGEGRYPETEEMIQRLLSELRPDPSAHFRPVGRSDSDEFVEENVTPELYLGSMRGPWTGPEFVIDEEHQFLPRSETREGIPALGGPWTLREPFLESAGTESLPARFFLRYRAHELWLVAEPPPDASAELAVRIDGRVPTDPERGDDVGSSGSVRVDEGRLYQLLVHRELKSRRLELMAAVSGIRLYTLAFSTKGASESALPGGTHAPGTA